MKSASEEDVQKILEMLHITENIELQVNLFSILAVHLLTNNALKDKIITSDSLYDKIHNVLSSGQPAKMVRTLNFISALLYSEDEETGSRAHSLTLYAQNKIRASGSLAIMANLFTNKMLHQEIWSALCRCLAECCRRSVQNQSYCSHLVPLLVDKCIQGSFEVLLTLKSLLNNYTHNVKLFFEANGILMLQKKDYLLHDTAMQLLNIIIQHAPQEMLDLLYAAVFENLERYKHLYGSQNKIGQWAIVNLYEINSRLKDIKSSVSRRFNHKTVEKVQSNDSVVDIGSLKPDDTARLIGNVIREIQRFNNANNNDKIGFKSLVNTGLEKQNKYFSENMRDLKEDSAQEDKRRFYDRYKYSKDTVLWNNEEHTKPFGNDNMSFSFLLKQQSREISGHNIEISDNFHSLVTRHNSIAKQSSIYIPRLPKSNFSIHNTLSQSKINRDNRILLDSMIVDDDPSLLDFKPLLVSTPKRGKGNNAGARITKTARSNKSLRKTKMYKEKEKPSNSRCNENLRKNQQRSMSTRLYDAINDSCTTFVKTFKNIFKSKKSSEEVTDLEESTLGTDNQQDVSCSYSFTKYMLKRDAVLSAERTKDNNKINYNETKLCKTCDDTGNLKRKVIDNSYLKDTVKKLKLGINLYGCDFKKISRAMWPRESYMTPEVLYNLYRKLIVK